jgi:hypothetical protein
VNTHRIRLTLYWWTESHNPRFAEIAVAVARRPVGGFSAWWDGTEIIDILRDLPVLYEEMPMAEQLAEALRGALIGVFDSDLDADELESLSNLVEQDKGDLGDEVVAASRAAIRREYESFEKHLPDAESEVTLEEQLTIKKLAPRAGIDERWVDNTLRLVKARQEEIADEAAEAEPPPVIGPKHRRNETYSDDDLASLFASLIGA